MEDRCGDIADAANQILVTLVFRARQHLLRPVFGDGTSLHEPTSMPNRFGRN